jgi:hypothetical protein
LYLEKIFSAKRTSFLLVHQPRVETLKIESVRRPLFLGSLVLSLSLLLTSLQNACPQGVTRGLTIRSFRQIVHVRELVLRVFSEAAKKEE